MAQIIKSTLTIIAVICPVLIARFIFMNQWDQWFVGFKPQSKEGFILVGVILFVIIILLKIINI